MTGWKLSFKYEGQGTSVDLEYVGGEQAVRFGLGFTWVTLGQQLMHRLGVGSLPEGLGEEALMLSAIYAGAPLSAYKGQYLRIEPIARVSGLSTSVHVEWGD